MQYYVDASSAGIENAVLAAAQKAHVTYNIAPGNFSLLGRLGGLQRLDRRSKTTAGNREITSDLIGTGLHIRIVTAQVSQFRRHLGGNVIQGPFKFDLVQRIGKCVLKDQGHLLHEGRHTCEVDSPGFEIRIVKTNKLLAGQKQKLDIGKQCI